MRTCSDAGLSVVTSPPSEIVSTCGVVHAFTRPACVLRAACARTKRNQQRRAERKRDALAHEERRYAAMHHRLSTSENSKSR